MFLSLVLLETKRRFILEKNFNVREGVIHPYNHAPKIDKLFTVT